MTLIIAGASIEAGVLIDAGGVY